MNLSDKIYEQIELLSESGNIAIDNNKYQLAAIEFNKAIDLLPEPKNQ